MPHGRETSSHAASVAPPLGSPPLVIASNNRGGIMRHVSLAMGTVPSEMVDLEDSGNLPGKIAHVRRLLRQHDEARIVTHGVAASLAVRLRPRRDRTRTHIEFWHADPFFGLPRGRRIYGMLSRLGRVPDVQVFVHPALISAYGEQKSRHVVLPNAIPNAGLDIGVRDRVVLFVGRYSAEKGVDDLLAAWTALDPPGWRLELHGQRWEDPASDHPGVSIFGETYDPMALMRRAALVVVPSHVECSPYVVLEALESGAPVVATRVGDLEQSVGASGAGWLAEPADPDDLARALREAIEATDDERNRRGLAGRAWVKRERSYDSWRRCICELYTGSVL